MKRCTRCETIKETSEFQRISAQGTDRLHSHCRVCRNAYIAEYKRSRRKQSLLDFRHTPFGADSPNAKLTTDDIRLIRELLTERDRLREKLRHLSHGAIAEKFDVSLRTISAIAADDRYSEVA